MGIINNNHPGEGAQYQPSHPDKLIQVGGEKSTEETKLQQIAESLIQNPEATLRGFVQTPLTDLSQLEGWEGRLQMNLKNRLSGNPDKRYLLGLRQAATGMSGEKEKIVTAAYLYELEHRNEMKAIPNYNPTVLFRLTLDFAKTREDLLGVAMKKYLDSVPLEEIYKNFKGVKGITPDDLPRLAEMSLERLSREEEASRKVLGDAKTDLFRPAVNTKNKSLQADSFFMPVGNYALNAERFTPEVLNHLLSSAKEENPDLFQEVVKAIDEKFERISGKNIPLDQKEFERKLKETPYGERDYLRRDRHEMLTFQKIVGSVPVLGDAYNQVAENRRAEATDKARAEEEHQRQLNLKHEQEKLRGEAEKQRAAEERNRIYQEEGARKREEANNACDSFEAELPHLSIDESKLGRDIDSIMERISPLDLAKITDINFWKIIKRKGKNEYFGLEELTGDLEVDYKIYYADRLKKESTENHWRTKQEELEGTIKTALAKRWGKIFTTIDSRLSLTVENPTINEYEEYIETLRAVTENATRVKEYYTDEWTIKFLQKISEKAQKKLNDILPAYEVLMAKVQEGERNEAMRTAQEEYLLKLIEIQTDYLKEIYGIGTGLDLAYVESRASRDAGSVIGSVSVGLSLSARQELRPEMRLELVAEEDNLTLEMGEDLASIKSRMAMANWIAPHEIAHLVDIASDMSDRLFSEEGLEPTQAIIENWKGDNENLAQEMIPLAIKETAIDAVGYRMVKEYGTANPLDETKPERIAAAMRGYVAMMDVLRHILETNAEDVEMKARYSIILLRLIADGEIMLDEANKNKINEEVIGDIQRVINELKNIFTKFNDETKFVGIGQANEIIELCKSYFKKAEQVALVKRPEE